MSNTPSDAELVAVMRDGYNCRYNDEQDHIDFARAVLAKWGTPRQEAQEPVWDGKLSDAMQNALDALYLECGPGITRDITHQVQKECEAIYTSYTTTKRMYQAARDRLELLEAAQPQPDPFAAPQPAPAPLSEKGECVSGCLHEERKDVMNSLVDGMQIQTHEKEILKVKMQLWRRVVGEIQASGVSQREAAHLLGVNQPRICSLISGKLDLFSTDMLIGFLAKCGRRLVVVTSQIDRGDTP